MPGWRNEEIYNVANIDYNYWACRQISASIPYNINEDLPKLKEDQFAHSSRL